MSFFQNHHRTLILGSNESSAHTEFSYGQQNYNLHIGHEVSEVEAMKAGAQRRFFSLELFLLTFFSYLFIMIYLLN